MKQKAFYKTTEFWFTFFGIIPGVSLGLAEVFLKATSDGTLDPSNPLYGILIGASTALTVVYTVARQINKGLSAFRGTPDNSVQVVQLPGQG